MPVNRKYNLALLLGTLREELRLKHKYKVLFEYVMLDGVNDRSVTPHLDNHLPGLSLITEDDNS